MTAVLLIDQAGLPAGSSGFARTDGLITGALVTIQSVGVATTHEARILTLPETDTTSISTFMQTGSSPPTWTFSPTAGIDGAWRIELVTDRGLSSEDRQVRVFGIRDGLGFLFPIFGFVADPEANIPDLSDSAKLIEFVQANELNEPRAGFPNGYPFGYFAELDALLRNSVSGGAPVPGATTYVYNDDFTALRAAAADGPNIVTLAGGGTATTPNLGFSPQNFQGFGWVNLTVPNVAGASARIALRVDMIGGGGGQDPVFRARVRLPPSFANAAPLFGLAEAADLSYARLFVNAGGFWVRSVQSASGGASNDTITAIAALTSATYDVRIEITATLTARFFVQQLGGVEVDLGTENVATTIPNLLDRLAPFSQIDRVAGVGTLSLDFWDVRGNR